ncbi:hypothetical protein HTZ84_12605 [Haloterrigena sp. SYSU A558-1]|uniref:Uncharacterized protein n=1 Tax=Haloterrigena gelatinilytica TaxID=2741724 RepID=A0A8J8GMA5_9EURY|nr:hypothetical protein [Haloterrigena gelatinilytica]NUB91044.1 hypothetical protein [Haloterrigena gelatinilytica]NUC73143.1 hypothetical protein [Haloterrigena gelatinilytica]
MHDVIPTSIRSDRLLLAVSFACFAVAGMATGTVEALVPTVGATAVAVAGVYCVAQYATRVSRRTLAGLSAAFWLGFLATAALHGVGLETVGATVPGDDATIAGSLTAVTWATLLTAVAATTFLGFREYGATTSADSPEEQVLEGDSDYSTQ